MGAIAPHILDTMVDQYALTAVSKLAINVDRKFVENDPMKKLLLNRELYPNYHLAGIDPPIAAIAPCWACC